MKTTILTLLAIVFLSSSLFGQNPIIWKKTYNSTYPRSVVDMLIIDTSYYLLCEKIQNYYDVELLSINKNSKVVGVSESYGGQDADEPTRFYRAKSSLYVYGTTKSTEGIFINNHGSYDGFLIKTDLFGNIIDTTVFGGSSYDYNITSKINNNQFLSMGYSASLDGNLSTCTMTTGSRQWVFSHDSLGNTTNVICNDTIVIRKNNFYFRNNHYYYFGDGTVTQNGGYTYPTYSPNGNWGGWSIDMVLIKYDTAFNIIDIKNYGSDSDESLKKSISTSDNGFMLFGYTDFIHDTLEVSGGVGSRDLYCVKLDSNANFQWSKCLGSLAADEPMDITQTADHGYLVLGEIQQASGNVSNFYGQRDMWLAKIDSVGNLLWERTYGGSYFDRGSVVREDSDGTIVIAGTTKSTDGTFSGMTIQGQNDMFVIKLAPWVGIEESRKTSFNLSVYPNPTHAEGFINLSGLPVKQCNYQLSIFNIQGQQINVQQFNASFKKQIQLPHLSNGVYFIRLKDQQGVIRTAKFIVY